MFGNLWENLVPKNYHRVAIGWQKKKGGNLNNTKSTGEAQKRCFK